MNFYRLRWLNALRSIGLQLSRTGTAAARSFSGRLAKARRTYRLGPFWKRSGWRLADRPSAGMFALLGGLAFAAVLLTGLAARHGPEDAVGQPASSGFADGADSGPAANSPAGGPGASDSDGKPAEELVPAVNAPNPTVAVWISKTGKVERMPLERYVRGVVAAEMPPEFELAALQAQAIAARTYAVKRMVDTAEAAVTGAKPSQAPGGALVSDTVSDQAYATESAIAAKWGTPERMDKLKQAVESTAGLILTYEDAPIFPAFFSTSGGRTENSENYWEQKLPYLRSVESPWEKDLSPRASTVVTLKTSEVARKLGLPQDVPASGSGSPQLVERTEGGQVKKLRIGGHIFTGREVREKLGLPSAQFTWKIESGEMTFTVFGYGHGVGMSQWGAQGLALQGTGARGILQHYYSGVKIAELTNAILRR